MPEFKPFPAIIYACFSRDLYRDVYLRWQGLGFTYLLLLNVIIITPVVVMLMLRVESEFFTEDDRLQPFYQDMIDQVASQVPPMEFADGELHTQVEQPYVIHVTIEGQEAPFAIIDLDASVGSLRLEDAPLLLTREAVHARTSPDTIETRLWSDISREPFVLDAQRAQMLAEEAIDWVSTNKSWLLLTFGLMSWVGTLMVMFLYRAAQALIFGGAAMAIASFYKFPLAYADGVRLACLAITPPMLIDLALGTLLGNGISLLLFIAIALGYLVFAIRSNQQVKRNAD